MVLDDGPSKDEEHEKHNASAEQDLVALDHSLSLILILFHDVAREDRRKSDSENVLEDAVEGRCGVLGELWHAAYNDACSNRHDGCAEEEEEPRQQCEKLLLEGERKG